MRGKRGVSLIELIVVVAIIGILAGVGFTQFNFGAFATRQAAQVVSAAVNRARLEAIRSNGTALLEVTQWSEGNAGFVVVCRIPTAVGTCGDAGAIEVQRLDFSQGDLARARITAPALVRLNFDRRGIVRTGAPTDIQIEDRSGINARTVHIAITGRAEVLP